jgi:RNA polymerase sigma-70 factor (ECF subfamily)
VAFDRLVHSQGPWLRGMLFGLLGDAELADDAAQIAWTRAWSQLATLQDPRRWRAWLARLARNAAIDSGRQRQRERARRVPWESGVGQAAEVTGPSPDQRAERKERQDAVLNAIRGLPAKYREPFVLRQMHGWSYQQIAEVMDLPPATVETRLTRARRMLREALAKWQ